MTLEKVRNNKNRMKKMKYFFKTEKEESKSKKESEKTISSEFPVRTS